MASKLGIGIAQVNVNAEEEPVPLVWLGQSADTSSLCSSHTELKRAPFLTSLGCAIRRPALANTHFNESLRAALGLSGPLMLDSGGFALSRNQNSSWDVNIVGDLIEKADADIFVTLDLPPSLNDSASVRRNKIIRSMRNYEVLRERFPDKTIMPVVHGRRMSEVELSLELLGQSKSALKWVGLGGIVPLLQNRRARGLAMAPECFIARAVTLVRAAVPQSRIHVFGAGGTRTLPAIFALGADSGDSIGWRQAAGYGSIFLPMKSQRVVKWNGDKRPPRKLLDESDLVQIEKCRCPICIGKSAGQRLDALRRHFYNRSIHNAWTLLHQAQYWPPSRAALLRIISNGALGSNWANAVSSLELGGGDVTPTLCTGQCTCRRCRRHSGRSAD